MGGGSNMVMPNSQGQGARFGAQSGGYVQHAQAQAQAQAQAAQAAQAQVLLSHIRRLAVIFLML